jgi:hypothetical protein
MLGQFRSVEIQASLTCGSGLTTQGICNVFLPGDTDQRELRQKMDFTPADCGEQFIMAKKQDLALLKIVGPGRPDPMAAVAWNMWDTPPP